MRNCIKQSIRNISFLLLITLGGNAQVQKADSVKRTEYLREILSTFPPDRTSMGHVSNLDNTFQDWLNRTKELPPDFDKMPSIPFLPDPLIIEEGKNGKAIKTKEQWQQHKEKIKNLLQYYITGSFPAMPGEVTSKILATHTEDEIRVQTVQLNFGTQKKAQLRLKLMIPPGRGPFPVFLTQWNHKGWANLAVTRGYIGCIYAGSDDFDDTEAYSEIWENKYDFTRLMRRAFGASRAIDYLFTLSVVDKKKIGLTGHSRNGKQSLWAAAFDERIQAVVISSGGSGAEVPWRYAAPKYDIEDISLLSSEQPSWLHPRLRFFAGRENKLPVDQNFFFSLIAPRGAMIGYAINETAANPYGIEQCYHSAKTVYKLLGAEDNIIIKSRYGQHGTVASDILGYIDFFDYMFGNKTKKPENTIYYNYTFDSWKRRSGELINPSLFPAYSENSIVTPQGEPIKDRNSWENKKRDVLKHLNYILGRKPVGLITKGPQIFGNLSSTGENNPGNTIKRPLPSDSMGKIIIAPYKSFGDYLYGTIYYPKDKENEIRDGKIKLPVVIYLHEYDYPKGFSSYSYDHEIQSFFEGITRKGYVVFAYDMMGFGNRFMEQVNFYERYPHWSKMGKMVHDLEGAVESMSHLNFIDKKRISVVGYSLGATVALLGAAQDERISQVVSVCGFTPLRTNQESKGLGGLKNYSHMEGGLIPRLGFFVGNENRVPFDFHEILSSIAPRKLIIVAPKYDKDSHLKEIKQSFSQAEQIYKLYNAEEHIWLKIPEDHNELSPELKREIVEWMD